MLPQHYEELTIRPYGFPPFPVNENGTLIVQQGERFCRVSVGHAICRCKRKFNSTANLRHHINKHEHVRAAPGRNSSTQAKDEAQRVFQELMRCARAYEEKAESSSSEMEDSTPERKESRRRVFKKSRRTITSSDESGESEDSEAMDQEDNKDGLVPPIIPIYTVASIPGDGIGPEVISAAITVLQKLALTSGTFSLAFDHLPWSSEQFKAHGRYIPEGGLEELRKYDAILFGSVGDPDVPDHISLTGLRLTIIRHLHHYANLRPTRLLRGCTSPLAALSADPSLLDWVIVRENSEGEYSGQGGRTHVGTPWEVATEVAIFTRHGIERIMRFAFETAQERGRKKGNPGKLCVVTKSNAQIHGLVLWDEVAATVSKDFPDVQWEKMLVDAMTVRMTLHPETLDTIVATNLHADILSDLAAALAGSIGIAPTSNLDPTRGNPSMFEPIHGSAFEIVGKGIANPIGAIWTAAEMLRWLGENDAADALMESVENVIAKGFKTADLGGNARTEDVTNEICREIEMRLG